MNFFTEFKWAVPYAFSSAIASCRFEQGDVLYNTPLAYNGTWGEVEQHINHSLQVKFPPRSSSADMGNNDASVFSANWSAKVVFELHNHKTKTTELIETTQGRLYTLLWKGNLERYLKESISAPKQAAELLDELDLAVNFIKQKIAADKNIKGFFIIPFCPASSQLIEKQKNLDSVFSHLNSFKKSEFNINEIEQAPYLDYVPTTKIVSFFFDEKTNATQISDLIKKALYKPSKDKKTGKVNFSVSNHGLLNFS
jgi:hypothetical protein